jgi:hypothetical protein
MTSHKDILATYYDIDTVYALRELKAAKAGHVKKEAGIKEVRKLNDQAYFMILFAQMEDIISKKAERLVRIKKNSLKNWGSRRSWDIINKDIVQVHFKSRLGLLLDIKGKEFLTISKYYKIRNDIAHKGTTTQSIFMPVVSADIEAITKMLKA